MGKTSLAKALAASIDCTWKRVQFTPDLLPADLVGVSIYQRSTEQFHFQPGPLFANIVLTDEINRASPKTQSALLESMEERQITVDGDTRAARPAVHGHRHPEPGRSGGHVPAAGEPARPVPDAHRPRLPGTGRGDGDPRRARGDRRAGEAVAGRVERRGAHDDGGRALGVRRRRAQGLPRRHLAETSRRHPAVELGLSPRATLQLTAAARSHAAARGRTYATPDDVKAMAVPALAHRLLLRTDRGARLDPVDAVNEILAEVPVPTSR